MAEKRPEIVSNFAKDFASYNLYEYFEKKIEDIEIVFGEMREEK